MKILSASLFVLVLAACSYGPFRSEGYKGEDTVFICHKGKKTLELPRHAAEAHLNHGDHYGRC